MGENYDQVLCGNTARLRREAGMTQEELAGRLGITFQAVSKWENGLSCPDIVLIPELATIFGVTTDELFGREPPRAEPPLGAEPGQAAASIPVEGVPWEDDGVIRAVVYLGKRLVTEPCEEGGRFTLELEGRPRDVLAYVNLSCEDVAGNVNAGGSVDCGDVEGNVNANGSVDCGDVEGSVSANGLVSCDDVGGDVQTNGNLKCDCIEGNVESCGGSITCDSVEGSVLQAQSVICDCVEGSVNCGDFRKN